MKKYRVNVNGTNYEVCVEEISADEAVKAAPAAPAAAPAPVAVPAEGKKISAPMPGTILSMNVKDGDTVKKGDLLMILEAMKMENEIPAPKDGKVAQVVVTKGATVGAGDTLVVLA